ncbi:TetR/AcrR family transcriptional regulator [Leucobacter sp. cx-328]|uniref:TetR/AcrR family transcriptional regulator n=1 Tax=unclassified Leucobacter TaxID=2621730 RepID=UPI00165E51BB|nr:MULTISPECIES: TetR/AcrR family transcriptional regulator [unclassified Leucobacter]MBC9945110.1 TetR/AcrR family transcriptional regulator [Leucobacter sp. cx-328]MBC9953781.1 TetR/AcrR family transcriptional regulator [Leucobacter sp. cx-42]
MARPHTPILSEERILAAVRVLSTDGDFTLAQLARALDVRVSSIYHHVPSKAAIVHLLRREWITQLRAELGEITGRERLSAIVRSYADFASSIPALVPYLVTEPLRDDELTWFYEDVAETLHSLGVATERILPFIGTIDAAVVGAAFDLLAPPFQEGEISSEAHPYLSAALATLPEDFDRRVHLRSTIDDLLTGLLRGATSTESKN